MRVVIVVKPAGMPSTAGAPKAVAEKTKAIAPAPASVGASSGRVIVRSVINAPAPAARAARSTSISRAPPSAAPTIRYTSGSASIPSTRLIPKGPSRPGSCQPRLRSSNPASP